MRFSAHIGYLFADLPLERRFEAAAQAGFEAVEHPVPFDLPAARVASLLSSAGLRMAQISSGTGGPGEKGIASLPGREGEFRAQYARALDYAETIGCPYVHAMAGVGADRATYLRNLDAAQALCEGRTPGLLIEAISTVAVPGYHMSDVDDLLSVAQTRPLHVLIDTFHAAARGLDPIDALRRAGDRLGHVHVADHPGRHEPGSGSLDLPSVLTTLSQCGYAGEVGFEYLPSGATHLNWLPEWRAARTAQRKEVS
jgi:hydroxypyruvate isomerase